MVRDRRSWTTVARGPLPNAGSIPRLGNSQGRVIATPVATAEAAQMLADTAMAT